MSDYVSVFMEVTHLYGGKARTFVCVRAFSFIINTYCCLTLKLSAKASFFKPLGSVTVTLPFLQVYFTRAPFCNNVIFPVGSLPSHSMVDGSSSPSGRA